VTNAFDNVREGLRAAEEARRAVDSYATQMAGLLRGSLRCVDRDYLADLKRELSTFDSRSKKWRKPR
jgi:hypothetical protein